MKKKNKKDNNSTLLLISTFILAIFNMILFFNHSLGLSVPVFNGIMLYVFIKVLNKKKEITNKKSYYLLIPIMLLSITYMITDNLVFRVLNVPVIIILIDMFLIKLYDITFDLTIIKKLINMLFKPFNYFTNVFNLTKLEFKDNKIYKKIDFKIVRSVIITIFVALIILALLTSADMIFASYFKDIKEVLFKLDMKTEEFIFRAIYVILFFLYVSATLIYIISTNKEEIKLKESSKDITTIKMIMITLNVIYLVFDIIQIKSLFLHSISMDISYAEYARTGFWQLLFISLINFIIILKAKEMSSDNKIIKISSIILILLTFIILLSSAFRMHMYEGAYGYTRLRLFVYIILFTEFIMFIPTIIYIIKNKFNIFKTYFIIGITIYIIINFINIDSFIARENLNRYYKTNKIDEHYILTLSFDASRDFNILYKETKNETTKEIIESKYKYLNEKKFDIREYNYSKHRAKVISKIILKD